MSSFTPSQRPLNDFLLLCYLMHYCGKEWHPGQSFLFKLLVWLSMWQSIELSSRKGSVVLHAFMMALTGSELQVVVVIF